MRYEVFDTDDCSGDATMTAETTGGCADIGEGKWMTIEDISPGDKPCTKVKITEYQKNDCSGDPIQNPIERDIEADDEGKCKDEGNQYHSRLTCGIGEVSCATGLEEDDAIVSQICLKQNKCEDKATEENAESTLCKELQDEMDREDEGFTCDSYRMEQCYETCSGCDAGNKDEPEFQGQCTNCPIPPGLTESSCNGGPGCSDPLRNPKRLCMSCLKKVDNSALTAGSSDSCGGYSDEYICAQNTGCVWLPDYYGDGTCQPDPSSYYYGGEDDSASTIYVSADGTCLVCPTATGFDAFLRYLVALLFPAALILLWSNFDKKTRPAPRNMKKRSCVLTTVENNKWLRVTWTNPKTEVEHTHQVMIKETNSVCQARIWNQNVPLSAEDVKSGTMSEEKELFVPKYIDSKKGSTVNKMIQKLFGSKDDGTDKNTKDLEKAAGEDDYEGEEADEEANQTPDVGAKDIAKTITGEFKGIVGGDLSTLLIVVTGLQMNFILMRFSLPWPGWYVSIFSWIGLVVNFNVLAASPPECNGMLEMFGFISSDTDVVKMVIMMLLPTFFFAFFVALRFSGATLKILQDKCGCLYTSTTHFIANEMEARAATIVVFSLQFGYCFMVEKCFTPWAFTTIPANGNEPAMTVYIAAPEAEFPSTELSIGTVFFMGMYIYMPFRFFSKNLNKGKEKGWLVKKGQKVTAVEAVDKTDEAGIFTKILRFCFIAPRCVQSFIFCECVSRFCPKMLPEGDPEEARENFVMTFHSVYEKYDPDFYYWELIVMSKKLIFVAGGVIIVTPALQVSFSFVVLSVFLLLQLRHCPYERGTTQLSEVIQYTMDPDFQDEDVTTDDQERPDKEEEDEGTKGGTDVSTKGKEEQSGDMMEAWTTPWEDFVDNWRKTKVDGKKVKHSKLFWYKTWFKLMGPDIKCSLKNFKRWGKNNTMETFMLGHALLVMIIGALATGVGEVVTSILISLSYLGLFGGTFAMYVRVMREMINTVKVTVEASLQQIAAKEGGGNAGADSGKQNMIKQIMDKMQLASGTGDKMKSLSPKGLCMIIGKMCCGSCRNTFIFLRYYAFTRQTLVGIFVVAFVIFLMFGPVFLVLAALTSSGSDSSDYGSDYYGSDSSDYYGSSGSSNDYYDN